MPEKVTDAIEWLKDLLEEIPVEYRASATIEVDSVTEYDGHSPTIRVSYVRPETDEEMTFRIDRRKQGAEAARQRELKQLAELKAKYE